MIDSGIIDCIKKASMYQGVSRIGIFGSYARGDDTDDSDIDILYDYHYTDNDNNGLDDVFAFLGVLEVDLLKHLGNREIDFVSYHAIIDSDNSEIRKSILDDVVWVYVQ